MPRIRNDLLFAQELKNEREVAAEKFLVGMQETSWIQKHIAELQGQISVLKAEASLEAEFARVAGEQEKARVAELARVAAEEEVARIAAEEAAQLARVAAEEEVARIAAEKAAEFARVAADKEARIAAEKAAEFAPIAAEEEDVRVAEAEVSWDCIFDAPMLPQLLISGAWAPLKMTCARNNNTTLTSVTWCAKVGAWVHGCMKIAGCSFSSSFWLCF